MRPTRMRTFGSLMCTSVLALTLAACGSDGSGTESLDPATTSSPGARLFDDCRADDPALDGEQTDVVAEADIDGSGAMNEIAYVSADAGGPCANALFTTFDGEPSAVPLGDGSLDQQSAEVVQLRGSDRQLLMVRGEPHPRGGYMLHLFGGADGQIGEVLADGEPLLGFVATDGGGAPATASCTTDSGIAELTAKTHAPPGIVLAWDVWRTTYTLNGNTAVAESTEQVEDAAADPILRKEMPQLFDPSGYLTDCLRS
jgi:hypothetical protein